VQPVQIKMARAALDLSVDQLASKAGVSQADILRLEDGTVGAVDHAGRVRAALEQEGIEWIDDNGVRFIEKAASAAVPVEELTTGNDDGIS
jgi:predicted transcriptional regulator